MENNKAVELVENVAVNGIFEVKTANNWIAATKQRPMPGMLFGEFWLEGEISILFADTGMGKSLLAVQIGESIARGTPIAPLKLTVKPQKVLYFDFELTAKQFEMRYAADGARKGHYRFSESFSRVEIRPDADVPKGSYTFERHVQSSIEPLIKETGARVLIVDNITYLRRSNESSREAVPLMRELKRLKSLYELSILVLAHTPKRNSSRPITVNDLQGSKVLSNFADNIFAIGQSKLDRTGRYVKHIKPRSTGMIYDASNVICFRLMKFDGTFLGFAHDGFSSETVHLADSLVERELDLIESIKSMSDRKMSVRQIAAELKMSKSQVHKLFKKWVPDESVNNEDVETFTDRIRRDPVEREPQVNPYYFPGREEYDEANNHPRYEGIFSREDADARRLRRESYLIESATAEARRIYLKTGKAPRLAEMLRKYPEFAGHEFLREDAGR